MSFVRFTLRPTPLTTEHPLHRALRALPAGPSPPAPSRRFIAPGSALAAAGPRTRHPRAQAPPHGTSREVAMASSAPLALVVCGPSGVGKGTLVGRVMEAHPGKFGFSVSHTTRDPRPGEENGVHYHFVSKDAALAEVAAGKFIEHAEVHGNIYGTSQAAVQSVLGEGKCCILDIDVQGARSVRKSGLPALFVFVAPPSFAELEGRLRGRGTETEDKIAKRLANARGEMDAAREPGLFDYILTNDDLDRATSGLSALVSPHTLRTQPRPRRPPGARQWARQTPTPAPTARAEPQAHMALGGEAPSSPGTAQPFES